MVVKQLNPHSCKTYLIKQKDKDEIILIDPILDHVRDYITLMKKKNYKLVYVIDTHTHADHISGSAVLKDYTDCIYIMGTKSPVKCAGYRVKEDERIVLGDITLNVIETPGHTKDSISLITENLVFTGDALFLDDGGAGRDDLPGGDPGEHWMTLQKLLKLPGALLVYPAHDYRNREPSSLAQQKNTNPHFKPVSKEEYVKYLEDLKLGPADWMKDVLKANYACATDPGSAWIPTDMNACEVKGTLTKVVNDQEVEGISADDLFNRIKTDSPLFLLDVRDPEELSGPLQHIENVVNIPITILAHKIKDLDAHKDREIIAICRSGARAYTGAQILKQAGFTRVKVLINGMLGWRKKGYPVN